MDIDDDHPLLVELDSLRETAARFQHEAHAAAIKLQRYSVESSHIYEHAAALEHENDRLAHEIDVLRAHPDVQQHPAVAQVQELSLALRRVSDKTTLTENTLLERTSELIHTRSELNKARHAADGAFELAARMRAREEASKIRERELERMVHASEEERKMVDLAVQEYADLVRSLEGRKSAHTPSTSNGSTSTAPIDTLQDGKYNLHGIVTAFSTESETLHATIAELNAKISDLQMTLDSERMATSQDRTSLSQTMTELDKLNLEDQTATKMVARYMKFSQASSNALQEHITTLKARHAATIATMELQLSVAESQLASERARTARLQDALDELCEDLARESYGRRREVALRLALLSREEGVAEFMRRWARRARELYARCYNSAETSEDAVQDAFHRVVSDAESILSTLDDDLEFSDATRVSGSMARITLSRTAVDALRSELHDEMQKRMEAVRRGALLLSNDHSDGTEDHPRPGSPIDQPLASNGGAKTEHEAPLPRPRVMNSPLSAAGAPDASIDDPLQVPAIVPPAAEIADHTMAHAISSPSITQDSASTSATLLIEEESKAVQSYSPAVSMLDLREDFQASCTEELPASEVAPVRALPSDTSLPGVLTEEEPKARSPAVTPDIQESLKPSERSPITDIIPLPSDTLASDALIPTADNPVTLISTPMPAVAPPPSSANDPSALFSELGATKHRYDALQRAFRDCSLALKELKRALASSSPSPHAQVQLRQHLETALARIDDYAEDARVELEIRVADEELILRGFEMMLSVPGALVDADERAEAETSARAFVDGTDEGVARALDKFTRKLEDVHHDVAVVKRAVHGLAGEDADAVSVSDEGGEARGDGGGWTAWTAGLLGAGATPARSPTPVETFGAVMTSPRLRHAASLKTLHGQEGAPAEGPLAGLDLRIPMPSVSPVQMLGVGRPVEGETRPRTLSAMYAVGGLRSASSLGLGVGLGGSPSPARTRGVSVLGIGSPLRGRDGSVDQDLDVE